MIHQIQVSKDQIKLLVKRLVSAAFMVLLPVIVLSPVTNAQEKPETAASATKAQHTQKHTGGTHSKHEEEKFPEFEFVASDDFRSVSLVAPIFRRLNIEGHYFGVRAEPEHEENGEHGVERRSGIVDLGIINGSYGFRLGSTSRSHPGSESSSGKVKRPRRQSAFAGRSRRAGFFRKGYSFLHCKGLKSSGG